MWFENRDGARGTRVTWLIATSYANPDVLLSTGNVFLVGGSNSSATWEIRNYIGGLVSNGSLENARQDSFTCNKFSNGDVIIVGSPHLSITPAYLLL